MAKQLTLSAAVDKNKVASDIAWIIALEVNIIDYTTNAHVDYLRVCRNDESLVIGGNTYEPMWFDINVTENEGELPQVSVGIQDMSRTVMYYMQNYLGGLGSEVTLMVVPIQQGNSSGTAEPDLIETFRIISASAETGNYTCTWDLGAENLLNVMFPKRRQHRDRCGFEYKSAECGYSGGLTTCLRTLTDCKAHSNETNYGGFPGIIYRQQ